MYGNCQIVRLANKLQNVLKEKVDIFLLTPTCKINNLSYFKTIVPELQEADCIITQNIRGEKSPFRALFPFMNNNIKVIIIDSLYSTIFHPELVTINSIPSLIMGKLHDRNIIKAYIEDIMLDDFLDSDPFDRKDFYKNDIYEKGIKETIHELTIRQRNFKKEILAYPFKHIDIIPFILNNNNNNNNNYYASWGDHNHPGNIVFKYLLKEILEAINFRDYIQIVDENPEIVFPFSIYRPVYKSTVRYFNLLDNEESKLYTLGRFYKNKSREDYIKESYRHYDTVNKSKLLTVYNNFFVPKR